MPSKVIRIGYARISTRAQDRVLQMPARAAKNCQEIGEETASARNDHPKLRAAVTSAGTRQMELGHDRSHQ
ncbi:hypothetical protein GCM10023074_31190 [Microbispora amethystogenes]|uniref:Resolvase/invertase-type recombinase catalytic domain-containing protein n=1 Tax=Microbispora amethystogenes TaxID=1427754 RepID=A0ABQ4FQE8_9ACTN|nr:hypothetical protein Mam01_71270 [Microbispora amethystogenes]